MPAIPQNRKAIRADAIAGRLNDSECDRGSDRGINGIAALLQHRQSRLGCEWLRRGDDIFCHHRHALGWVGEIVGEFFHGYVDVVHSFFGFAPEYDSTPAPHAHRPAMVMAFSINVLIIFTQASNKNVPTNPRPRIRCLRHPF